jgi:hypothetical protein
MNYFIFFILDRICLGKEDVEVFVVNFYENRNLLLSQLLKQVPAVGDELKIKGRKGKVANVTAEGSKIDVQVKLEAVQKGKLVEDLSKKKKR